MEQVVIEDKLEQEQLFQQEAEARAATKVTPSPPVSTHHWVTETCLPMSEPGPVCAAAGLVERLHGPPRPQSVERCPRQEI